jgi:hypothetical protein
LLAKLLEAFTKMLSFATKPAADEELKQEISKVDDGDSLSLAFKNMLVRSNFINSLENANKENLENVVNTIASILFASRPFSESNSDLLAGIQSALNKSYLNRFKKHDMGALNAIVFAIQISEYARNEGFEYILVVNRSSKNGIFIKAKDSFIKLLSFYESHEDDLVFNVVFSERQGAHKISVK